MKSIVDPGVWWLAQSFYLGFWEDGLGGGKRRSESKATSFASRLRESVRLVWVRLTFFAHTSGCLWKPRVEIWREVEERSCQGYKGRVKVEDMNMIGAT